MKYKVNENLEIEILDYKPYKVSKAVKLALLDGVRVKDWETPEIPAENSVKAEEALILGMTNLTREQLDNLTEEKYQAILEKINEITTNPRWSTTKKDWT